MSEDSLAWSKVESQPQTTWPGNTPSVIEATLAALSESPSITSQQLDREASAIINAIEGGVPSTHDTKSPTTSGIENLSNMVLRGQSDDDKLTPKLEHIESFNIACVGESGLGKSTLLRSIFAHLEATKVMEMKGLIEKQQDEVQDIEDRIRRNTHESSTCEDDNRSLELLEGKRKLRKRYEEADGELRRLKDALHIYQGEVASLNAEICELEEQRKQLRQQRDAKEDLELGRQITELNKLLQQKCRDLRARKHRHNLDLEGANRRQTTKVETRTIESMPLYEGAKEGLEVTMIDMPGYGDIMSYMSADKVVAEVERRIMAHLVKVQPTDRHDDLGRYMPLDDEKKYWNELVHMCLFFIPPHRMKRADLDLMKRLHTLLPIVVVIAKSDTMTKAETRDFKNEVCRQLKDEGIDAFHFSMTKIREVEMLHMEQLHVLPPEEGDAQLAAEFSPLYGGENGELPWAVMGADESCREYEWGTALTDNPRHSELPALRDLVLRMGGWQELKQSASRKADETAKLWATSKMQRAVGQVIMAVDEAIPRRLLIMAGMLFFFVFTLSLGMSLGHYGRVQSSLLYEQHALLQTTAHSLSECEGARKSLLMEMMATKNVLSLEMSTNNLTTHPDAHETLAAVFSTAKATLAECKANAKEALAVVFASAETNLTKCKTESDNMRENLETNLSILSSKYDVKKLDHDRCLTALRDKGRSWFG